MNISKVSCFEDRIPFLLKRAKQGQYIVSDIKSKLELKDYLLKKNELENVSCVERVSDFFIKLLLDVHPEYSIISPSHTLFLFKMYQKKLPHFKPNEKTILEALQFFLPILSHPEGETIYNQWISENKTYSIAKLKEWFLLSKNFWSFLQDFKVVEKSCIKYLLLDKTIQKDWTHWNQPLTIDLSFSIDFIEAEIFSQISKYQEVEFLTPLDWSNDIYPDSHIIYSFLKDKTSSQKQKTNLPTTTNLDKLNKQTFKVYQFQTMIEEVQFITEHFRKLLENNKLSPENLTIIAPNIETY